MASNQELLEREGGSEETVQEPSIDEYTASGSVLYVDDVLDEEDISAEAIQEELEGMSDDTIFYISPEAFARVLEHNAGQHQAYLYDTPEDERPDEPELPEVAEQGIEEVAEILSGLPAESGRIDAVVYDREGDPQYIRTYTGEVSGQVLEKFWKSLPAELEAELELSENGYVIEL